MLYNCENPLVKLLSVERLTWDGGLFHVPPRNYSALAYRISGNARFICDGKEYCVGPNDILYLPAGLGYQVEYTQTDLLVFHFNTAYPGKEPEVYRPQNSDHIYKLFLQASTLWNSKAAGYTGYVISTFYKCLGRLCEDQMESSLPANFLDAVSYINANFRNGDLNIGKICLHAAMSETNFRQLFKLYYDKTPLEYITDLRLENARNLIAANIPVATAATESGFNDAKYFSRVVKRKYNCTPRDLKNYGK